jgi:hypothetical protein
MRQAVPSRDPLAIHLPSGLQATHVAASAYSSIVLTSEQAWSASRSRFLVKRLGWRSSARFA